MAASIESSNLANQIIGRLTEIRVLFRRFAADVPNRLNHLTPAYVGQQARSRCEHALGQIAAIRDLGGDTENGGRQLIIDGLAAQGLTLAMVGADLTQLEDALIAWRDASMTTKEEVIAAAEAFLESVPAYRTLT